MTPDQDTSPGPKGDQRGCLTVYPWAEMRQLWILPPFPPFPQDNSYVTAIKSVGGILAPYDSDQMIPVYGFGARLPPNGEVSHCFPLTLDQQRPEVNGVQVSGGRR